MADKDTERKCICRDTIMDAKDRKRGKPQPWLVLKFTVALTIAIVGYTSYVYVARLCLPMILEETGALGSRVLGSQSSYSNHCSNIPPRLTYP